MHQLTDNLPPRVVQQIYHVKCDPPLRRRNDCCIPGPSAINDIIVHYNLYWLFLGFGIVQIWGVHVSAWL